jgi:2-polyprenyl-3-methyl-5-hydroxy-6-metoxy-1,4-benzoquinol methylase
MEVTLKLRARHIARNIGHLVARNSRVLDIGCGNGVVSAELARSFGFDTVGTDVAEYLETPIPFKRMRDPVTLDFETDSFDLGLMVDMLHHIDGEKQLTLVREAARVCKTVIVFEAEPSKAAFFFDVVLNRVHNKDMPVPLTHRPQAEWEREIRKLGLACSGRTLRKPFWLYPFQNFILTVSR